LNASNSEQYFRPKRTTPGVAQVPTQHSSQYLNPKQTTGTVKQALQKKSDPGKLSLKKTLPPFKRELNNKSPSVSSSKSNKFVPIPEEETKSGNGRPTKTD
jgi:hypothetical protein